MSPLSWLRRRRRHAPLVRREQILDSLGEPVLVLDCDRVIMDMNLAAVRLADRLVGSSEWRGACVDALFPFLKDTSVTGADVAPTVTIDTADASYGVRISRVRATRAAWLVVLRDVTAERRAIADRERFVRQHTDLVSTVSHELRTPAAAIQGALQLVLGSTRATLAPDDRRLLEGALRSCDRLAGIVYDILDISTIETPRPATAGQRVAIERLVIDALFDAGHLAAERTVRVETSLATDLPLVRGHHDRLVQVFVTLLTTAISAAPAGSSVTLHSRREKGWVVLDVQGAGNAWPPGQLNGELALSRALVEQDGGRLAIERSHARGARVVVRLQQSNDTRKQSPRVTPTTVFPRGEQAIPPNGARVLVADDDPDLRDIVSEALQSEGFTVLTAENGVQADDLLAQGAIDLAVIDLIMPRRSGADVIRGVRAGTRQPGLPILVLTGSLDEREAPDGLGADVLLTKPTDLRRLVAEVKALLARPGAAEGPKA